jgi:signal transduction histidine kinase
LPWAVFACALLNQFSIAAAEPSDRALHTIKDIRCLSSEEAAAGPHAEIEAIVNVFDFVPGDPPSQVLFLHDGADGIYANCHGASLDLQPGERVRVEGRVAPGLFAPELLDPKITPLGPAALPEARRPSYEELASGRDDSQRAEVEGIVRSVSRRSSRLCVQLAFGAAHFSVAVAGEPDVSPRAVALVDARVRVRGAVRTFFNAQRQMIDVGMYCSGLNQFEIIDPPRAPEAMAVTPVKDLLTFSRETLPGHRIKVRGVVTYQEPGSLLFIKDDARGLLIKTSARDLLNPGDEVEVLGFPVFGISTPIMEDGEDRRLHPGAALEPAEISAADAASGKFEADLVSLRARLLEDTCQGSERVLWLQSGSVLFQATQPLLEPAHFHPTPSQSEVLVTGICLARGPLQYLRDKGWAASSFEILVPGNSSVKVVREPPWWTPPRIVALLAIVATCLVTTAAWVHLLRRRVRQQTNLIRRQVEERAVLQERNRIAREFHDTFAQGFAATAFQLEALGDELAGASEKARRYFTMALTMVRHSLVEARRAVAGLRAEPGEARDLPHALRAAGEMLVASSRVEFAFNHSGPVRTLPPPRESDLLRIGQEAVSNAMRHASARRISMELHYLPDAIRLRIEDNGKGFVPDVDAHRNGHFGLQGMEERARQIGAKLNVESRLGEGTVVTVQLLEPALGEPAEAAASKRVLASAVDET